MFELHESEIVEIVFCHLLHLVQSESRLVITGGAQAGPYQARST
jgi:hypothetical protein